MTDHLAVWERRLRIIARLLAIITLAIASWIGVLCMVAVTLQPASWVVGVVVTFVLWVLLVVSAENRDY